jgi:hypothetical protein
MVPLLEYVKADIITIEEDGWYDYAECFVYDRKICTRCGERAKTVANDGCCIEIECTVCNSVSVLFKSDIVQ